MSAVGMNGYFTFARLMLHHSDTADIANLVNHLPQQHSVLINATYKVTVGVVRLSDILHYEYITNDGT